MTNHVVICGHGCAGSNDACSCYSCTALVLEKKGVSEVVRAGRETGVEILRHIMCRLAVPMAEVEETIVKWASAFRNS